MSSPVLLIAADLGSNVTGKRRFAVAGETIDIEPAAIPTVLAGKYSNLARERQHHRDLWAWCQRHGHDAPLEFQPTEES